MHLTLEQLSQHALQLPVPLRAQLANIIMDSLADAAPDDIGHLWAAQAIRRRNEIQSGKVAPLSGTQVLNQVRRAVGR